MGRASARVSLEAVDQVAHCGRRRQGPSVRLEAAPTCGSSRQMQMQGGRVWSWRRRRLVRGLWRSRKKLGRDNNLARRTRAQVTCRWLQLIRLKNLARSSSVSFVVNAASGRAGEHQLKLAPGARSNCAQTEEAPLKAMEIVARQFGRFELDRVRRVGGHVRAIDVC